MRDIADEIDGEFIGEEYQRFVESMVEHCRCEFDRPCDGVLAGGLCDDRKHEPEEESEVCDGCGWLKNLCGCEE